MADIKGSIFSQVHFVLEPVAFDDLMQKQQVKRDVESDEDNGKDVVDVGIFELI